MKLDNDEYVLSSGRRLYAHFGIIGINPELKIYEGYGGGMPCPYQIKKGNLTVDDMRELADYMISLWGQFRITLKQETANE